MKLVCLAKLFSHDSTAVDIYICIAPSGRSKSVTTKCDGYQVDNISCQAHSIYYQVYDEATLTSKKQGDRRQRRCRKQGRKGAHRVNEDKLEQKKKYMHWHADSEEVRVYRVQLE
ncbi:hypothetical protein M513_02137 [Trichuris suis]|uniref:Uncharacterized protein n=1 Tax=Trichuris suis TaxID=68888 RepID=A0A085MI34_9BILA|nr:hypothetical protein M513_02137 [Trichuris suis]